MKRLRLSSNSNNIFSSLDSNSEHGNLDYLRIEDNGTILAVFTDDSEIDISELFPVTVLDDYKDHKILESC